MENLKKKTNKVDVEIFTNNLKIIGFAHLRPDSYRGRLTDLLNEQNLNFLPVTDAKVFRRDTEEIIYKTDCIALNKDLIEAVIPIDNKE